MEFIYTWLPAYRLIVEKITSYHNNQIGLIEILKEAGVDGFNDKDESGNAIPLIDIDPFTFLCCLNKYGDIRRKKILMDVCNLLGISPLPKDSCGVPTSDARKLWLFPYKGQRTNNEIDRLWNFFEKLLTGELTDADFSDVLQINSVGKTKLSEVMYMVKPADYLCLNGAVKPYLQEKFGINTEFNSYTEFKQLCEKIREVVKLPFHEISFKAYIHKQYANRIPVYYRIGSTENGESRLEDMQDNNLVSIGWSDLGDIELMEPVSKAGIQNKMKEKGYYGGNNSVISRKAGEIWRFYHELLPGDLVLVADGESIKAIGKIASYHYIYEEDLAFSHCRCVEWLKKNINDFKMSEGLQTSVWKFEYPYSIDGINDYLGYQNKPIQEDNITAILNKDKMHLNTILFGPPGTGKTFKLQQIIKDWKLIDNNDVSELNYELFVEEYSWWELLAMALLDQNKTSVPQLRLHPLVQAKFNISNIRNPGSRLWSTLQNHTVLDCPNVSLQARTGTSLVFYKEADSIWRLDNEPEFRSSFPELVQAWDKFKNQDSKKKEIRKYIFTTCHQSLSYEDFIEGIKPKLVDGDTTDNELNTANVQYEVRKGIFYKACNKACQLAGYASLDECIQDTPDNRKAKFEIAIRENNIMVLFLDEINRCNVSAVFGELITLIEADKRLGALNEITDIMLPYSQQLFAVPGNLYIIGTMNTADRSVESLDTALRRRFSFESMPPDTAVLNEDVIDNINLGDLLTRINERIAILLDRDHQIGHSYFIGISTEDELKSVFNNKIIPLLQEYFYNDYGKIGLVLGSAFVEVRQRTVQFPKGFQYENKEELAEGVTYLLVPADKWTSKSFESIYND
ncbi:5-methylcytosine-specific restriction enzyme B [Chitinophaga sp. CF118]|uniref:AAA family ATPase n=1 Tax=Chitinophaga sp. CF118 TaxID=1884367 RepID=UPI0008E280A3|nr:AAA family ATPase [Chitinophaga sp. CF118]SFD64969.1 5-methylcytosine-specific restriction enzyme B [Chitinophaga sp. CF118]